MHRGYIICTVKLQEYAKNCLANEKAKASLFKQKSVWTKLWIWLLHKELNC